MAWTITFCTLAAILVTMVEGQMNLPYSNPYAPPSGYRAPAPAAYPPQATPPQTSYQPPQPAQPPPYNQYPAAPAYPMPGHYPPAPYQQSYLVYTKQVLDCTDLTCQPNECCEYSNKKKVCVPQNVTITNGTCVRPKRCDSSGDCPSGHCCVIRLDVPYNPAPYSSYGSLPNTYSTYGSSYSNSYSSYGSYLKKEKEEKGECIVSALIGEACRKSIDGLQTSVCPCSTGLMCMFPNSNPLIGVCS